MKQKQMEKILKPIRDDKAMELFNKHEYELNPLELKELDDWMAPRWKLWNEPASDGRVLEVSNIGTVRYADTKEPVSNIYYPKNEGYPFINVISEKTGKHIPRHIHHMVARAFIPNPDGKPEINHIDGVKTHNWVGNLEWTTHQENMQHAFRTGLSKSLRGEDAPSSKYTNEQIHQVCQLLQDNPKMTYECISKITGVTVGAISSINRRELRCEISKDYTFPFRDTVPSGEDHPFAKYTEEQVKQVCELLVAHPDWTYEKIAGQVGVSESCVSNISNYNTWTEVSKDYNFPLRKSHFKPVGVLNPTAKLTEDQVETICNMLDEVAKGESKITLKEIAEKLGLNVKTVENISSGARWISISKNHYFYKKKFG